MTRQPPTTTSTASADRAELLAIHGELERMHAWRGWHWWPDADPFEVTVGSILVQNTAWTNVERAIERLKAAGALQPHTMRALSTGDLEALVQPSGQYRQKARKLMAFLDLCEENGGFEALLALPAADLRARLGTWGIGPETADAIVLYAARQLAFVVDAYTARLFSRLGLGPGESADYDAWQRHFAAVLEADRDLWARYHALIVMHCKHTCRKLRPRCDECTLATRCEFALRRG